MPALQQRYLQLSSAPANARRYGAGESSYGMALAAHQRWRKENAAAAEAAQ
jgi:hypothetical protein